MFVPLSVSTAKAALSEKALAAGTLAGSQALAAVVHHPIRRFRTGGSRPRLDHAQAGAVSDQKYWQAIDWSKKRVEVELLQDKNHPDLPKLMLDFLRVPLEAGDEPTELAQAIALGFIGEDYDRFADYYGDRGPLLLHNFTP